MAAIRHIFLTVAAAVAARTVAPAQTADGQGGVWDIPRTGGETITEPSPEATAMRRYQDYPVSYATGTADISIPLLGLPGGATSVQLGLSYHTGGIRKTDISTGVGLGWTLTGLGSVSRQINGFPDEWRGEVGRVIDFEVRSNTLVDVSYLKAILEGTKDTEYDCYSYSIPGYSGSFYIVNGQILELPASELQIVPVTARTDNTGEISRFEIHTPDGVLYTFEDKEYSEYRNFSTTSLPPAQPRNYLGVSQWNLTEISSALSADTVRISYAKRQEWMRINDQSSSGYSMGYTVGIGPSAGSASISTASYEDRTTFRGHSVPQIITTSNGIIEFTRWENTSAPHLSAPADYISSIKLKDRNNNVLREIALDNSTQFMDGRQKLTGITITQDGTVTDRYIFAYNDATSDKGYDMFGYPNGKGNAAGYYHSILNENLSRSLWRESSSDYVSDNCLTSISDISGLLTTIEYEPATINVTQVNQDGLLTGNVTVGVRIKRITASDTITGRKRQRHYTYSSALCNIPLELLTKGDFISQSGNHIYYYSGDTPSSYSLGTTFTASSTLRGASVDGAVIYYGKVSEEISGTDLPHNIVTEYEYDLSDIQATLMLTGQHHTPDDVTFGNNAGNAKSLASFDNATIPGTETERYLAKYHPSRGYLSRIIGATPLLKKRTEKEWASGGYRVNSVEENFHSRTGQARFTSALYCESMVFRYTPYNGGTPTLNVSSLDDVNYFYNEVSAYRTVLDSTVVTRYYPDGQQRSVHTVYINSTRSGQGGGRFPGFYTDSIQAPYGIAFRPLGKIISSGSESIASYTACTGNITSSEYYAVNLQALPYLPVVEKWIVSTAEGRDSLLRQTAYSPYGSKWLPRPSHTVVETAENSTSSRALISEQRYSGYDARGRITAMTDAAGRSIQATWHTDYDYLTSLSLPDVGHTTTYTYKPLVGCTSITAPSGRKRQFSYEAGRLASERNTAGETVATYSYRLYGDGSETADPANRFTATLHDNSGTASQTVDYDGFGMAVRTVADVAGGGQTSTAVEYDALDRPVHQFLPVPVSGGVAADPASHYGDNYPYRTTSYRPLRTDAPLSVIAEGALMQSHPATVEYLCNTTSGDASLRCRHYRLTGTSSETVTLSGYYPAGALDVARSTDPDGHRVLTFTDWRGFRILERRIVDASKSEFADTYWLYDPMGRVRVILQPEGAKLMTATGSSWTNSSTPIKKFAFISRYDRRGNCIYSLTPGGGPARMAYDPLNRLALRQTATMAERSEAEFMLYDPVGRPAVTGIMRGSFPDDAKAPSTAVTFSASETGIGNSGYTLSDTDTATLLSDVTLTTVTYYDSYACRSFTGFSGISASFTGDASLANGLPTATRTAVYAHDSDNDYKVSSYLYTLMGYDREGRVIQQVETTALAGSRLITNTTYTRQGRPALTDIALQTTDSIYNVQLLPDYDATGNLIHESSIVNSDRLYTVKPLSAISGNQAVVTYSYDPLGQLSKKQLNSGKSIEYQYNLRGQLSKLSHPAFVQTLYYETGSSPCYNGNISSIKFRFGGVLTVMRVYKYDTLNRLIGCTSTDGYHTSYTYNLNSSPLTIKRYGLISDRTVGLVDDLSMTYGGNRVLAVSDAAASVILESSLDFDAGNDDALYGYDADGRMTSDTGRGITSISYAPNDRPVHTEMDEATFNYLYSADGRKLKSKAVTGFRKLKGLESFADEPGDAPDGKGDLIIGPVIPVLPSVSQPTEERYYIGPFELTKSYNDKMVGALLKPGLARVNMSWGYVDSDGNNCEYVPDYQGNIRVVMKGNQVIQQTDYYPYGLPIATSAGAAVNRYKYSGKEFDTRGGLNAYDFDARLQLPTIGLFSRPDPLAIENPGVNPYLYCNANPIMYTDPTGMVIDEASKDEWDAFKKKIESQRDRYKTEYNELKTIQNKFPKANGINTSLKEAQNIFESLEKTLTTMATVEQSEQVYSLNQIKGDSGFLSYDSSSDKMLINYVDDENFVHELTHAGQYENGDLVFLEGNPFCYDIYDELEAYKSQDAFSGQDPTKRTMEFLNNPVYMNQNIGVYPLNVNSTLEDFERAFPGLNLTMPAPSIRQFKGIKYKGM